MPSKLLRYAAAGLMALVVAGCEEEVVRVPPVVTLSISPNTILNDGEDAATVTVTAKDELGQPATGTVVLTTSAGEFEGSERAARALVVLADGIGETTYTCSASKFSGCNGKLTMSATFGDAVATAFVTLTDVAPAEIAIEPDRDEILGRIGDESATVRVAVTREGKGLATRINAKIDRGAFAGVEGRSISLDTDSNGEAELIISGREAEPGPLTLTVEAADVTATASLTVLEPEVAIRLERSTLFAGIGDGVKATFQLVKRRSGGTFEEPVAAQTWFDISTTLGQFRTHNTKMLGADSTASDASGKFEVFLETIEGSSESGTGTLTARVVSQNNAPLGTAVATETFSLIPPRLDLQVTGPTNVRTGVRDSTTLMAQLRNESGAPIARADLPITFQVTNPPQTGASHGFPDGSGGLLTSVVAQTDGTGKATVTFAPSDADASTAPRIVATLAGATSLPQTISISRPELKGPANQDLETGIGVTKDLVFAIEADGTPVPRQDIDVTVRALRSSGGSGVSILVDPSTGATSSQVVLKTDAAGTITATLDTGSEQGAVEIRAEAPGITAGSTVVNLKPVTVDLTCARGTLYTGFGDETECTVTVSSDGRMLANRRVNLATTLGALSTPYVTTGLDGSQTFKLIASNNTGEVGTAAITASLDGVTSGPTGTHSVQILALDDVEFIGTAPVLGVSGSGKNETALLRFRVSSGGVPVGAGVPVTFTTGPNTKATLTLDTTFGHKTDAQGVANVTIKSGAVAENATVRAEVPGAFTTLSVPVRWNLPSARGMTLTCSKINLDVYNASQPKALTVPCTVKVLERDDSNLQVETPIRFLTEAGTVPDVLTIKNSGTVDFNFVTSGTFPEPPFGGPLKARPAIMDGSTTLFHARPAEPVTPQGNHPRARYVTLVAWAEGEEQFTDTNTNGVWDPGEPFVDVPAKNGRWDAAEPFADVNLDGVRQSSEAFLDVNGNGVWDDAEPFTDLNGNGVWDPGEPFVDTDRHNGIWDPGEAFTDLNGNNAYDRPEPLVDLPEPFVDKNDNGWWDLGEQYADINNDGMWNPPNGVWDQKGGIWTQLILVYSGAPVGELDPSSITVPAGSSGSIAVLFSDAYLNPLGTPTTFTLTREGGSRGTMTALWGGAVNGTSATAGTMKDGYGGSGPVWRLVGMRLGGACESNREPICIRRMEFESWFDGYIGTVELRNPTTPSSADEIHTIKVTANANGNSVAAQAQAVMKAP